jgi:hypothetical protein
MVISSKYNSVSPKYTDRVKRHFFSVAYQFIFMSFFVLTLYKPRTHTRNVPPSSQSTVWVLRRRVTQFTHLCARAPLRPIFERLPFFNWKPLFFSDLCILERWNAACLKRVNDSNSSMWQLLLFDMYNLCSIQMDREIWLNILECLV